MVTTTNTTTTITTTTRTTTDTNTDTHTHTATAATTTIKLLLKHHRIASLTKPTPEKNSDHVQFFNLRKKSSEKSYSIKRLQTQANKEKQNLWTMPTSTIRY